VFEFYFINTLVLQTIKHYVGESMSPEAVLADFEEALTKGFTNVFPWPVVYNDFFHFMNANTKRLGQMGCNLS
jgi:hypothetical protein